MTVEMRKAERFIVDDELAKMSMPQPQVKGHWERIPFEDLKKGDIFRLWEPKGGPDHLVGGKHDVCVALTDVSGEGSSASVESLHVNGMIP